MAHSGVEKVQKTTLKISKTYLFHPGQKKTHQQQLTTGYCLQYECVGSRSNDSAVVLGIYQLQLQSAVLKTHFAWVNTHTFAPFQA